MECEQQRVDPRQLRLGEHLLLQDVYPVDQVLDGFRTSLPDALIFPKDILLTNIRWAQVSQ